MKKSPEVGLCVLLTPQGICSWGSFLGHPAEMEEQEAAPEPCWGTRSTAGTDTEPRPSKHGSDVQSRSTGRADTVWNKAGA